MIIDLRTNCPPELNLFRRGMRLWRAQSIKEGIGAREFGAWLYRTHGITVMGPRIYIDDGTIALLHLRFIE